MGWSTRLFLVTLSFLNGAEGSIPGTSEPPVPGPLPLLWVGLANDAIGVLEPPDDFRTNQMAVGLTVGRMLLVADHSVLTSRDLATRSDEFTCTLGVSVGERRTPGPWTAIGVGVRLSGDYGGERGQNTVHRIVRDKAVHLPYERDRSAAVAYAVHAQSWCPVPWGGVHGVASGLATTRGEFQAEAAGYLKWSGASAAIWAGVRWRGRFGDYQTRTAEIVADDERGRWWEGGASIGWLAVSAEWDSQRGRSTGKVIISLPIR